MQEYFEERNKRLHITLQNIDDNLNRASEAHGLVSGYRTQLIDACNDRIQPPTTATDDPILVRAVGCRCNGCMSEYIVDCPFYIRVINPFPM